MLTIDTPVANTTLKKITKISGKGTPGRKVAVTIDGNLVGYTEVKPDGTWEIVGKGNGDGEGEGEGLSRGNGQGKGEQEMNDHGSGSGGDEDRPWEDGKPGEGNNAPGITNSEGFAVRREVATKVREQSNGRGTHPAGWEVWADTELQPPRVRWQDKLRAYARQAINRVAGERLNTFRRLSRSSIVQDCKVIKPSTFNIVPTLAIVVDTSGSMGAGSHSRLERALSECEAIIKLNKCKSFFIDCDAAVYSKAQEVKTLRSAKINGGGGTDMRIGVRFAKANKPKPDIIILLTDGDTPWPEEHEVRGLKIITGICNEREDAIRHTPSWMNPIWVDTDRD